MLSLLETQVDAVTERIAQARGSLAWCWLARDNGGGPKLLLLTIRSGVDVVPATLRYGDLIVSCEQLEPAEAARRLRDLRASDDGGPEIVIRRGERVRPYWLFSRHHVYARASLPWPTYYVDGLDLEDVRDEVQRLDLHRPLLAPGSPHYPSLIAMVSERLYGVPPEALGMDMRSGIFIALADDRARIGEVTFEEGVARVPIEERWPGSARGLALHASWRMERGSADRGQFESQIDASGTVHIDTTGVPAEMSIALADDSELVDHHGWAPDAPRPEDLAYPVERIRRLLLEGEHRRLDYKQSLNEERDRVVNTIAAFANGEGGTLLLGVDNDLNPVGHEGTLDHMRERITSMVRDRIDPPVDAEVSAVDIDGHQIFVIDVPSGDAAARPYMCRGRVYVRPYGSTRIAKHYEVRLLSHVPRMRSPLGLF